MGVPGMSDLWDALVQGHKAGTLGPEDTELLHRVSTALAHLRDDPYHPGLQSHEIDPLTRRYGIKVFQSYVDNRSELSRRLFWVYGPNAGEITIIGLEPHPEDDKTAGYDRVRLDALPAPSRTPPTPRKRGK
jgi:hypothetical protein